nr:DUF6266 family protein [uncultured Marinifilum sp.]
MGKYTQGILGPFSGKVGAIVGSSWKGVNYIKSLPGPNTSNTEKQQVQRSRFKSVVKMASSLLASLIRPVWNLSAGKITGYNLFVKTNLAAFDESGELSNFEDFKASVGSLVLPGNLSIVNDTEVSSGITVSWSDESANGIGQADDQLHLLILKDDQVQVLHPGTLRSAETADVTLPFEPGMLHVYAYFGAADGSEFSVDLHETIMLT